MKKIYLGFTKCKFLFVLFALFFNGISSVNAQSCPDNDIGFNGTTATNTLSICDGVSTTTIDGAAPAGNPGPTAYAWEVGPSSTGPFAGVAGGPTSQNWTISATYYNNPGTYYFRRIVSNSDPAAIPLCDGASDVIELIVVAIPAAPAAGGNTPLCVGSNLNLTASPVAGATYDWTGPNSFTSTNQNPNINNVTLAEDGVYSVKASISGCESPAGTVDIQVNPIPPAPTATSNSPVCANTTLDLFGGNVPGATPIDYDWTGPNSFNSPDQQDPSIPGITVAGTGTYFVTVTINGCTSTQGSTSVIVNPIPATPTASNNGPVCVGGNLTLSTPNVGGATYSWTGPGGYTSASQNPAITGVTLADAGSYSVTVTVNNCTSLAGSTVVVVNPIPATPAASNNGPLCVGATLNLTTPNVAGGTFDWTGPNAFSSPNQQNPVVTGVNLARDGVYFVTVTVNNCASLPGSTTLVVNPIPSTPTAANNGPLCVGATLNLTTPNVAGGTFDWTGPGGYTSTSQNPSITGVTVADAGAYNVTVTVNNCTSPAGSTTVVVNPIPATPTATNDGPVCVGGTLNLSTPVVGGAIYSWTGPGGYTSALRTPAITGVTVGNAGTYFVTVTVNNCTSPQGSTIVVVNTIPAVPTAGSNTPICAGSNLNLTASNVPGATYSWTGPNTFTSPAQNPTIAGATTAATGTYFVTATISGCTSPQGSTIVTVNPIPPAPTAGHNAAAPGICAGTALNLTASNVPGATYSWTGPNSFTSPLQNPTIASATAAAAGVYNVTATVNNCTSPAGSTPPVVIKPLPPTPTPTSNSPVCVGNTLNLSTPTLAGGSYSWTGPNSFTSPLAAPSITNVTTAAAGVYSVTVTVNLCTSASASTPSVVVNTLPTITLTTTNPQVCRASSPAQLPYTATSGGVNRYSVDYDAAANAAGLADIVNAIFPASPIGLPVPVAVPAGSYNGSFTVSNGTCPSSTIAIVLTVKPIPVVQTVADQTVCMSGTSGATITTINLTSVPAGATFSWTRTNPGGNLPATGFNLPLANAGPVTTISGILTNTQPGQNTVPQTAAFSAIATLNGCASPSTLVTNVTVNPRPNASFLEWSNDLNTYSACTGGLVAGNSEDDIDVIQGFPGNGNGQWMYSPNVGGPFNIAPGPGNATVNQYVFGSSPIRTTVGSHYFFYQSNIGGCITRSDTISLIIYLSNNAPAVTQPGIVCGSSGPVNLTPFVTSCGASTQFKFYDADYTAPGGGVLLYQGTGAFSVNPAVTTTYYVACINTSTSCESFRSQITIVRNNVVPGSIGTDQVLCTPFNPAPLTEVAAATGDGVISYQWQSSTTAGAGCVTGFTNIAGATGAGYTLPGAITQTTKFRRVATSTQGASLCTANSNCVTISYNNVNPGTIAFNSIPPAAINCSNYNPFVFANTAGATGGGAITYQWQSSTTDCTNGFTDIAGAITNAYDPGPLPVTTYFRRTAISTINAIICTAVSNCLTIVINNVTPGTIAADQSVCASTPPVAFTEPVPATGTAPLTYQWQSSLTAGCSAGFSGTLATTQLYTPPATLGTIYYRRIVRTNGLCAVISNCVAVTVLPNAVGGTLPATGSACGSGAGSLTVSGITGTVSGWQLSTDGGATWSPTGTPSTTLNYTITQQTMFRAVVMNGTCGPAYSTVATISLGGYWTGTTSTDWNIPGNWSDNQVPTTLTCPDVYIPGAPTNQPTVSSAVPTIRNLHILSGAAVTVNGAGTLPIDGTITNTGGTFDASAGRVEFNGTPTTGAQTIAAGTFVGNMIKDLVISNSTAGGVSLGGPLDVTRSLTYGPSGTQFVTNGNLTLKSTASGTAWLGNMTGRTITGAVRVERYFPARKAWRFLSVPALGQTINAAWQEGCGTDLNCAAGFGIQITDDKATWNVNGFDRISINGPSMKTYSPITDTYTGIPSTGGAFQPALGGYMTFVRGNRASNSFASPVTSTTLRPRGTLFTGTQAVALTVLPTPHMNPYAAPLDMRLLSPSGSAFFYLWDPNRGGNYGLGAWQTLTLSGGNYVAVPGGGSYPPSNINNFIESGQAFLASGAGNANITENTKGVGNTFMAFRPSPPPPVTEQQLRSNLISLDDDTTSVLADGTLNAFADSYSDEVDAMDARKLSNFGENMSIKVGGKLLVIERRPTITGKDTIFLNLTGVRVHNYQFQFNAVNMTGGIEGFLEDNYLHSRTPLNLGGNTIVNFTVENIPGSFAADRFRIVFAPTVVLPVTFTSVKAFRLDKNIKVEWKVENEKNISKYEVERSANGIQFTTFAIVPASGNNGASSAYVALDVKPVIGYNYYRIKSIDTNGKIVYTNVVKVLLGSLKHDITINPNPITDGMIHLQLMNQPEGQFGIRLLNKLGQVMLSRQINRAEGSSTELIKWDFKLAHGIYQLEVTRPDGSIKNISVLY